MTNLVNEYNKLSHYLDFHIRASGGRTNKNPLEELKSKKVRDQTKQLLEESEVHSYVPEHIRRSLGFDVKKFESLMRTRLIDDYKRLQGYERPYVSVGELYNCQRQNYYNRLRYPIDIKQLFKFSYLYLIQKIGNEIHSIVQELYDFTEIEKTVVSERYKVKGRIDGIRGIYLFEIKSIDVEKFENEYKKEHYLQANTYAYILNSEYEYNIKKVVIVYVIRNLKNVIAFDVPVNDDLAISLLKRAPLLHSALEKREVIDPFGATNELCKWCLHRKSCQKDKCIKVMQPFVKKAAKKEIKKEEPQKSAFIL
jgi:CRISPR/Cas system-associated exonuclease Cas4 (RecB family)